MSSDSQEIGQLVRIVLESAAFGKNKLTGISHREKILHDWGAKHAENLILYFLVLSCFKCICVKERCGEPRVGLLRRNESWMCYGDK